MFFILLLDIHLKGPKTYTRTKIRIDSVKNSLSPMELTLLYVHLRI
jgi:hypothetical protein